MGNVIVSYEDLKTFVINKLVEVDVKHEHAETVADVLVHADLRGVHSHGVLRTEHYVKRVTEGGLNPNADIKFNETGPVTGIVDGDDGFGHVIGKQAMKEAIQLAEKNGIGMVSAINSSHCGALSYFVNQATESHLIGMAVTHTDKVVVPFGGSTPFFGTNPIAYGFPANRYKPVILDMATSQVAFGKVLQARESGKDIPLTWGVDEEGQPTSNPYKVSALLPFGGAKGYGMAMVVDILSGVLTGSAFGPHVTKMYGDYNKMRKLGHLFCAINPAFFTDRDSFLNSIDQMIEEIHKVPATEGFERVMVPGEPEQIKEEEHLESGIPIPESIYNYLKI